MTIPTTVRLEFDPKLDQISTKDADKQIHLGLSAVVQIGDTLWVANDETLRLERLSLQEEASPGSFVYGDHATFHLDDYLELPIPPKDEAAGKFEEADLEGLDYRDGYLWVVGSHSGKRKKVKNGDSVEKRLRNLKTITMDGNRHLLARIPVIRKGESYHLSDGRNGSPSPRQLRGTGEGNELTSAVAKDDYLEGFLGIPSKENGFDVEGLAVTETSVFLGLRGPVLRGWSVILELQIEEHPKDPSELRLKPFEGGSDGLPYRKHFLQLDGLGVRDLCVDGSNLLVLAGPTMVLDGAIRIFRWKGGAYPQSESMVFRDELEMWNVPAGIGEDRAEGMCLFRMSGVEEPTVLLVHDSPAATRLIGNHGVVADVLLCV